MKASKPKANKLASFAFWAFIVFVVSWILLWGDYSFLNTWKLKHSLQELNQSVEELKVINDSLREENMRLKTSPEAAEKAARERFGLTKPGEKVFRFVTPAEEAED